MAKLRMGRHNAISAERFHIIRGAIAEGMSDEQVMKKYDIKHTTLAYIQKSKTYYEYQLYTEKLPAAKKIGKVIAPSSGLTFEDYDMKKIKQENEDLKYSLGVWIGIAIVASVIVLMFGIAVIVSKM